VSLRKNYGSGCSLQSFIPLRFIKGFTLPSFTQIAVENKNDKDKYDNLTTIRQKKITL
jgi:hypothetical protein